MSETTNNQDSVIQTIEGEYKSSNLKDQKIMATNNGPKLGSRHIQMLLLTMGLALGMASRTNFSVAIVAMTDNTTSPNPNVPSYNWSNTSILLSSLFWSYITLQVVAGYLGKTYGAKYSLLVGLFVNYCACAIIPLAAEKLGFTGVMICRIVQGFGQSFLFPSLTVLLGRWVPEQERTTLSNIAFSGSPIGSIFASIMTGYVSASWWGWPASFYILSIMGTGWCIIWFCFGYSSPDSHPHISDKEKYYIQSSLKQEDNINLPVPWKKIFSSVPFYALLIAQTGNVWGYTIMMTETPTYLSKAMNFDVESSALVSAIPSVVKLCFSLILGPLSDWVISRKVLSREYARKGFALIGNYGQALCLVWLSLLQPSQASWSVFVLGLGDALSCFVTIGSSVNFVDLSPRFSGIIYGLINTCGMAISLIGPISANWIVTDSTSVAQWQWVFLTASGFMIVGGTVFFFFASASRQPWDGPQNTKEQEIDRKVSVISLMSI